VQAVDPIFEVEARQLCLLSGLDVVGVLMTLRIVTIEAVVDLVVVSAVWTEVFMATVATFHGDDLATRGLLAAHYEIQHGILEGILNAIDRVGDVTSVQADGVGALGVLGDGEQGVVDEGLVGSFQTRSNDGVGTHRCALVDDLGK
jgi:hypothetical protein